jgi:hypothetical protein
VADTDKFPTTSLRLAADSDRFAATSLRLAADSDRFVASSLRFAADSERFATRTRPCRRRTCRLSTGRHLASESTRDLSVVTVDPDESATKSSVVHGR